MQSIWHKGLEADIDAAHLPESVEKWIEDLPETLTIVWNRITSKGGGIWIVGGALRQVMLGEPVKDIDLATTLPPDVIMDLFPDSIPTGIDFGTVTVRMNDDFFEITTIRSDGFYRDGRRPEDVTYGTLLSEDLARRDFTFNSMALDVSRLSLYDPWSGQGDLLAKRIRSVGDSNRRLSEDGLRIMRAYRFMDQGESGVWQPDISLETALIHKQYMIDNIARERVWAELRLILNGSNAGYILANMAKDELLDRIFEGTFDPESRAIRSQFNKCLDNSVISPEARLGLLLKNLNNSELEPRLRNLKLSNAQIKLVLLHHRAIGTAPADTIEGNIRRYRYVMSENLDSQLLLEQAWIQSADELNNQIESLQDALNKLPKQKVGNKFLTDGKWIMRNTGIPQGPSLGRLKEWLHRIQIERDLSDIGEIEQALCTMGWQHSDYENWPRLTWP